MLNTGGGDGGSWIGTFLGWAMAAIYMGGRLPQIYLNVSNGLDLILNHHKK
jgi:solute carrier family 66 (lysosomal lysine-arginine transporter), member 1